MSCRLCNYHNRVELTFKMNIAFIFLIVSLIIEKVDLNSDLYSVTSLFSMHRDSSLRRNIEITFLATCL